MCCFCFVLLAFTNHLPDPSAHVQVAQVDLALLLPFLFANEQSGECEKPNMKQNAFVVSVEIMSLYIF